jgi:hypothetical protein
MGQKGSSLLNKNGGHRKDIFSSEQRNGSRLYLPLWPKRKKYKMALVLRIPLLRLAGKPKLLRK